MHNSQSSDSGADQPAAMPPPPTPPTDNIPPPSPISAQPLQVPQTEHDQPSPTSPHQEQQPDQQQPDQQQPDPQQPDPQQPDPQQPDPQHPPPPTIQPKEETAPLQAAPPQPRRQQRQKGRPGRPPNINENSLMRRLECVMAVESGRMTMITACQQYDISARTFYRWLRNKDRLIQLTGFTEDDFKNGNPPVSKQTLEMHDSARMPVQRSEPDPNLPRLPNQPAVSAPENRPREASPPAPSTSAAPPFAASKRRLPKAAEPNPDFPPHASDRFPSPNAPYYRRNFTKMPPQSHYPRDPAAGPSERQAAARNATRMRRDSWHDQPPLEYVRSEDRAYPVQYTESPPEVYKRRKVVRSDHIAQTDDPSEPIMITPSGEPHQPDDRPMDEAPTVNGNSANHHEGGAAERPHLPREGDPVIHGKTPNANGGRPPRDVVLGDTFYDPRAPRKHRIEIMMGRRKVTLAWYDGTSAEDIKSSIARRFALLPEAQWALMDHEYDEIIISDGLPSGRYTLTVLS